MQHVTLLRITSVSANPDGSFSIAAIIKNWSSPTGPALTTYDATLFDVFEQTHTPAVSGNVAPTEQHHQMVAEAGTFGAGPGKPA